MWFYFALATAVLSSVAVIIKKRLLRGVSASVVLWGTLFLSTPPIAVLAIREGLPKLNGLFFVGIGGSVLLYTLANIGQLKAMRTTNLSAVYPLAALGPVVTFLAALLPPLSEKLSPLAIGGVAMALSGAYLLNVSSARTGILQPLKTLFTNQASLLMLVSIIVGSLVVVFDKIAINNTFPKNTTFPLLAENILIIAGLLPLIVIRHKNCSREILAHAKLFALLGLVSALYFVLGFTAIGRGPVGLAATIFKAEVLFVLLFNFLFFKDKPKLETVIGSIIMILGVALIKIGS